MNTFYEVLDTSTGNVIKDYPTEEAALEELGNIVEAYGVDEIRDFALPRFEHGRPTLIAKEEELVARLRSRKPTRQPGDPVLLTAKP